MKAKAKWDFPVRRYSLIQDIAEWRRNGIGSSDAPVVMGKSPWMTPYRLWEIKTARAYSNPPNFSMQRGIDLEPKARRVYEQMTGIEMPAERMAHSTVPFIRANFDGINKEEKRVLEIKCPGPVDHRTALKGKIPDKYLWQCVHLLLVSGYEHLDYFSFDGKKGVIVPFTRDRKLEKKLLSQEFFFWRRVLVDIPPKMTQEDVMAIQRNSGGGKNIKEPGEYRVRIVEIKTGLSKKQKPMLTVAMETSNEKSIAAYFVKEVSFHMMALKNLKIACGLKATDTADKLVGKECGILVEAGEPGENGRVFMQIVGYGSVKDLKEDQLETVGAGADDDEIPF